MLALRSSSLLSHCSVIYYSRYGMIQYNIIAAGQRHRTVSTIQYNNCFSDQWTEHPEDNSLFFVQLQYCSSRIRSLAGLTTLLVLLSSSQHSTLLHRYRRYSRVYTHRRNSDSY